MLIKEDVINIIENIINEPTIGSPEKYIIIE